MKSVDMYLGDSVCLAILRETGGPRAVGGQFSHYRSGRIGGHWDAGGEETRKGASAKRRISAGTSRIWSNTAANSVLTRVTGRARRPAIS